MDPTFKTRFPYRGIVTEWDRIWPPFPQTSGKLKFIITLQENIEINVLIFLRRNDMQTSEAK